MNFMLRRPIKSGWYSMSDRNELIKILTVLQRPLQLVTEPFQWYARQLGISSEKVLSLIQDFKNRGIIRRYAGIVKHDRAGYNFNAMVVFEVEVEQCDKAGEILSGFPFITHCYRRTTYPDWQYNLYAMMHARDEEEFSRNLARMKEAISFRSMDVLRSVREFKKSQYQLGWNDK